MNQNNTYINPAKLVLINLFVLCALVTLPGCANKTPGEPLKVSAANADSDSDSAPSDNHDPLEPLNRGIFKVNEVLDGMLLRPLCHIYRGVMPEFAQNGVRNALDNLASPVVFLNSVLQNDPNNAGKTLGRFAINSTVGIAGLFDVAKEIGIKKEHAKDFGQTMGVYGVGSGPYLMIPILGPSDTRDILGRVADVLSDPFTWILTADESYARAAVDGLVRRNDLMPLTDRVYRDSLDPYATFRSVYLQHRENAVRNYLGEDSELSRSKDAK